MRLKLGILLLLSVVCSSVSYAQSDSAHFRIRYVVNIPEIDTDYLDNESRIDDIREFLDMVKRDSTINITDVWFKGTASPEGSYEFNVWLSENRLRTFKELVRSYVDVPDSIIRANVTDIPWDGFREKVAASDMEHKDEILAIIDEEPHLVPWTKNRHIDSRLIKLMRMYNGKVFKELKVPILQDLRYGDAIITYRRMPSLVGLSGECPRVGLSTPGIPLLSLPTIEKEEWVRRLYLKTNLIDDALLIGNVAVEVDLAPHWSFTLPVYYSAVDYFKSTLKFRMLGTQPEFRYWPSRNNQGFFIGAHFGATYYNFAFNGEYRYQDYKGKTPTTGGGLSIGFRKPISKNKRWHLEFSAGAGIYPLHYDVFFNTDDVKNGQLVDTRKKTFIGLDQAAITIGYSFDIQHKTKLKKGGKK